MAKDAINFKFQSDSINTSPDVMMLASSFVSLNSNLILLIPAVSWQPLDNGMALNSNLILLIRLTSSCYRGKVLTFKFQSDSINTLYLACTKGLILVL